MTPIRSIFFFVFFSILIGMYGCGSQYLYKFEKQDNLLTIFQDSLILKNDIINESIIHIKKSLKGGSQSIIPDYVTILEPQNVPWKVLETKDQLIISTDALKIMVNSNGTITYEANDGKQLLAETNELTYISDNTVSQAFIAGDEGLYGLGQYQSGIMNWKNIPTRLEQFNQEIAIPFLVSTNQYGIYWHNYSVTDFNRAQHEIEFSTTKNKTEKGSEETFGLNSENVIEQSKTMDEEKNIRKTTFIPQKTGMYTFFVESDSSNRMRGEIRVAISGENLSS